MPSEMKHIVRRELVTPELIADCHRGDGELKVRCFGYLCDANRQ